MIVVTGSAGFIGSCLVSFLNKKGHTDLILVDDFSRPDKKMNYETKSFIELIDRNSFGDWFLENAGDVSFVFHLGARTDTTEMDPAIFDRLNLKYTIDVWQICRDHSIPLVYASSAATYGNGGFGYKDDLETTKQLKPMNPYGWSKYKFDLWALKQETQPPRWYGLKFFNVYGPNEYHKGRMASVVLHAFRQIQREGMVRLFRSHKDNFKDGEQLRDFIYVEDVLEICYHFYKNEVESGLYNVGTGKASTFLQLVKPVFASLDIPENIEFIDIPEDIRATYQYFTQAEMDKLKRSGYNKEIMDVRDGVSKYVSEYLKGENYY